MIIALAPRPLAHVIYHLATQLVSIITLGPPIAIPISHRCTNALIVAIARFTVRVAVAAETSASVYSAVWDYDGVFVEKGAQLVGTVAMVFLII